MKKPNRLHLLLAAVILVVFSWFVWSQTSIAGKLMSLNSSTGKEEVQDNKPKDPCWFMSLKDETISSDLIEARTAREDRGYPAETPLSEAVRIFNEETKCKPAYATYPPLTEDELIAAIVAGPDYGKQGAVWVAQKDALWQIATKRMMPKGSLLVVESGGREQASPLRPNGTIQATGIRITLLLDLDKASDPMTPPKAEQTLVIRKSYSKIEIVK
jgi:hypothetical protein